MSSTSRVVERTVICDRCSTTALCDQGERKKAKPKDWARIVYSAKVKHGVKPSFTGIDLCPRCAKDFRTWLEL